VSSHDRAATATSIVEVLRTRADTNSEILLAIHLFKIEAQKPFLAVMYFVVGGFLVHAWLPSRLRPAFFVLLSLAGIVFLLGWPNGARVLALGGGLLVLCHLPIPMIFRVLLIVVVGGLLAMWRVESSAAFWPILGSMFMFRLMVYLYDLSHERRRPHEVLNFGAGITPDMSSGEIEARLQPFASDSVRVTYAGLVKECRKRHVLPVWIYLPMPGITEVSLKSSEIVDLAEEAGFVVVNLAKWSDGYDPAEVKLSATDYHANARGHQVITGRLYEIIRERPELLPPWTRKPR